MTLRDRRSLAILALLAASALCVATVEIRTRHTGDSFYGFLIWNLVLAWLPLAFALAAYECARRQLRLRSGVLSIGWLLFFPNAPYMLTDFIHLQQTSTVPLWYDALMLSAFAWTGLLLGFVSLYLMQMVWLRAVGPFVAWLGVVCALALGSFGVYLGRFMRFNSWDALLHPKRVLHVVRSSAANPLTEPRVLESLLVLTASLAVAYVVLYSFAGLRLELERQ